MKAALRAIALPLLTLAACLRAQDVPFEAQPTGVNHSVFIGEDAEISLGGQPVEPGDAIGAFYRGPDGAPVCGGAVIWQAEGVAMTVYGNDGLNPGFASGETMRFKVWDASEDCVFESAEVEFQIGTLGGHGAEFVEDGISTLASLDAAALALSYPGRAFCQNTGETAPSFGALFSDATFSAEEGLALDPQTGRIDLAASQTGAYTVRVSSGACFSVDSVEIEILPAPAFAFTEEELILCEGETLVIAAPEGLEGLTLLWSNGSAEPEITVSEGGQYRLTATNAAGCAFSDTAFVLEGTPDLGRLTYQTVEPDCDDLGELTVEPSTLRGAVGPTGYRLERLEDGKGFFSEDGHFFDLPEGDYTLTVEAGECQAEFGPFIRLRTSADCGYAVITPDGDGLSDRYYIPFRGMARVYDQRGALLREISAPGHWDGTDRDGHPVRTGHYLILNGDGTQRQTVTVVR